MARLAARLYLAISLFAIVGASGVQAGVLGDVQMRATTGPAGQGVANPGPVDLATYKATAGRVSNTLDLLNKIADYVEKLGAYDGRLAAEPQLAADISEAIGTLEDLQELLGTARAETEAGHSPSIVWDDSLPKRFSLLARMLNPENEATYALWYRLTNYVNSRDLDWHGKAPGESVDEKDPDAALIIPLRSATGELLSAIQALRSGSHGLIAQLGHTVHVGYTIVTDIEPFIASRGGRRISVSMGHLPFNEDDSQFNGADSGIVDLSAEISVSDTVAFGVNVPFAVFANSHTPELTRLDGIGDVGLRIHWTPSRGGSGFQFGLVGEGIIPTARTTTATELGTGFDVGFFNVEAKGVWVPSSRGIPRLHFMAGRHTEFDDEVDLGSTELAAGLLWAHDGWRNDSANRFNNVAAWVDIVGTLYDDAQPAALTGTTIDSAWDLRIGLSVFKLATHPRNKEVRHAVSGEVQRRLDEDGRNSTLRGQMFYSVTF